MSVTLTQALVQASRPKTLTASLVPIVVATALLRAEGLQPEYWISALALAGAFFIQIATNFLNDSIDFKKGADKETRLGEARVTAQNWLKPQTVMWLGFLFLALAFLCGIPLVWVGGWPIVVVGIVSMFLAYGYTGGPYPLAYKGLGDLFVILFFGVIAVGGVYFLHTGTLSLSALVAGLQVGLLATVLIAVNNIRDMEQDRLVHKRTLSVRLGAKWARMEVPVLFSLAFLLNGFWAFSGFWLASVLPLLIFPLAWKLLLLVLKTEPSRQYNQFLAMAAKVHLAFGLALSCGLILS